MSSVPTFHVFLLRLTVYSFEEDSWYTLLGAGAFNDVSGVLQKSKTFPHVQFTSEQMTCLLEVASLYVLCPQ